MSLNTTGCRLEPVAERHAVERTHAYGATTIRPTMAAGMMAATCAGAHRRHFPQPRRCDWREGRREKDRIVNAGEHLGHMRCRHQRRTSARARFERSLEIEGRRQKIVA